MSPTVRVQMLIRRPAHEVFEAFVDPTVTTRFWFTRSTGRLAPGAEVRWDWEMYGASAVVRVREIEPDRRIVIDWGSAGEPATRVEWTFEARADGTLVVVTNTGFQGTADEVVAQALDSTGGFTFLLSGAKALLEHGVELNLVADHHPDAHVAR